jgi:hypothetical protein
MVKINLSKLIVTVGCNWLRMYPIVRYGVNGAKFLGAATEELVFLFFFFLYEVWVLEARS